MEELDFLLDTMQWSFSRLNAYYNCPYEWKMHYLECNKSENGFFGEYGSLIHEILEKYAKGELSIFELNQYYEERFAEAIPHDAPPNKYVAIFDPVELEGTVVTHASVHNVSILTDLDLQIGDTITVYKANQIIPQIRENLSAKNRDVSYIKIPEYCPVCGEPTQIIKDNDTEVLVCLNPYCKGRLLGRLSHFVSKKGMDIDGLSEETLRKFIDLDWLKNIFDIYCLPVQFDKLSKMYSCDKICIQSSMDICL